MGTLILSQWPQSGRLAKNDINRTRLPNNSLSFEFCNFYNQSCLFACITRNQNFIGFYFVLFCKSEIFLYFFFGESNWSTVSYCFSNQDVSSIFQNNATKWCRIALFEPSNISKISYQTHFLKCNFLFLVAPKVKLILQLLMDVWSLRSRVYRYVTTVSSQRLLSTLLIQIRLQFMDCTHSDRFS